MSGCLVRSLGEPTRFPLEHTASQRPAGDRAQGRRGAGSGEPGHLWLSLPILQPRLVVGPSDSLSSWSRIPSIHSDIITSLLQAF